MRNLLMILLVVLRTAVCINTPGDDVTVTEDSITDLSACFDSSCKYDNTEDITESSDVFQMEKSTSKVTTTTISNKNTTDAKKKIASADNSSQNETTKDKDKKTNEVPRKPKPKPKPKPKEDKSKTKMDPPLQTQNKTSNITKQESKLMNITKHLFNIKSCNCDINSGICEINCCCDNDCTKENKKAFSHCEDESNYVSRTDYCFSPNVIYKNNTPYKAFNLRPGLLCIARENLPDKIKYYSHKIIESDSKILNIIKRRKIYHWETKVDDLASKLDLGQPYSFGSHVWILQNFSNDLSLEELTIAHEGVTSLCQDQYQVGYLENVESTCLIKSPSSKSSCIESFIDNTALYKDIRVLKSTHLINASTDLQEVLVDEIFLKVHTFFCTNSQCINSSLIDFNQFNEKIKACSIIKKVSYLIKHNGTRGIVDMRCFIHFENSAFNGGMFRQQHEVKFEWISSYNLSFPRSGKPGYLSGKPLISGNRTEKIEDDNKKYEFNVSRNTNDWISIMTTSTKGFCSKTRTNIMFNDNIKAECLLTIKDEDMNSAENCSSLHETIMTHLFGKAERLDKVWLSSWGDPNTDDRNSWVPLVTATDELVPSCTDLITSAHYHFLYSLSGPLGSPQAKLIGAIVEPNSTPYSCEFTECNIKLITTVTFSSVTSTPRLLYPKHPALRIHLPKDFFYPFSSSSSASCLSYTNYILPYVLINFLFLFTE